MKIVNFGVGVANRHPACAYFPVSRCNCWRWTMYRTARCVANNIPMQAYLPPITSVAVESQLEKQTSATTPQSPLHLHLYLNHPTPIPTLFWQPNSAIGVAHLWYMHSSIPILHSKYGMRGRDFVFTHDLLHSPPSHPASECNGRWILYTSWAVFRNSCIIDDCNISRSCVRFHPIPSSLTLMVASIPSRSFLRVRQALSKVW